MENIIIEKLEHGYNVIQGDKYSDQLGWDEMLGTIAALTMPKSLPCVSWLKTKEEHEAWRNSLSPQVPKLEPWQKLIEKQQ